MKRIGFALVILTLSLLACARTFNSTSNSSADTTHTLTFGGLQRTYVAYPVIVQCQSPAPLVFDFSWRIGKRIHSNAYEQLRAAGGRKDFIVVYPNGTGLLGDKL